MASTLEVPLKRLRLDLKRTLDVGCGYGQCLVHFGPGSVGLDIVEDKVAFAQSLGLDALRCDLDGSLEELGSRRFEAIWCSDPLEHLHAPFRLLTRLADHLADDGVLVAYVTVRPGNPLVRLAWKRFLGAEPYRATTHHYQFTLPTIRYLLERAGFRVTERIVPGIRSQRANRAASAALSSLFPSIVLVAKRDSDLLRSRSDGIRKNREGTVIEAESLQRGNGTGEAVAIRKSVTLGEIENDVPPELTGLRRGFRVIPGLDRNREEKEDQRRRPGRTSATLHILCYSTSGMFAARSKRIKARILFSI